jgi:hypothetical protein
VRIDGDLGQIDAGDESNIKPGVLRLSAISLGSRGLTTQLPGGSLQSDIVGALKTVNLANAMHDATVLTSGDIGTVTIKGSVFGSALRSDGVIGSIKIAGDLAASDDDTSAVSARGRLAPNSPREPLAIGRLSIGGSVYHAEILAGYNQARAAVNGDASIGVVTVGGNWTASSLVAGVTAGTDGLFGTDDDKTISRDNSIVATIASLTIKGTVGGSENANDQNGLIAAHLGAVKVGKTVLTLTRGARNDLTVIPLGLNGDVAVREVS